MAFDIPAQTGGMDQSKPEILFAALRALLANSSELIFVKDMNLSYVACTDALVKMVGKTSADEVLGRTDYEIFEDKEFSKRFTADDLKLFREGKDLIGYVEPLADENGEARYSTTSKYILTGQDGAPIGLLGISKDITREMKAEQQYQQQIEYLFTLPEDTYSAIFIDVTDWRIVGQRRKQEEWHRVPLFDSMESLLTVVQTEVYDTASEAHEFYQQFSQKFLMEFYDQGKSSHALEYQRVFADGKAHWIRDEWRFMTDPRNGHLNLMVLIRDINSKKQAEKELEQAARTDRFTGLLNRAAIEEESKRVLEMADSGELHAVFMLDLDDFKRVNDTYGHLAGDALLVAMAKGIRNCFGERDIVGRIGGDEFFVLATHMPDLDAVKEKAEQLLRVSREIHATNTAAVSSVSIGISLYSENGTTLEELYAKADEALYKAKGMGKDQAAFASDEQTLWSSNAFAKRYAAYNSQVVEHSNSICYISDMETYDLLHMTKAGMELYGMTKPEEYLGKKCYQVIMGLDHPCPYCTNSKLAEGQEYRWEHYNENIEKWFDRTSSIIHLDGRPRHLEIGRDITARREELSLLSGKLSMEDVLFRCLHTLTQERDLDTAVNLFLEAVGGFYQANRAYIFEFDLDAQLLDNTFEWCAEGISSEIDNLQRLPLEVVDNWIRMFETKGEFSISSLGNDVDRDSEEYRILEMQGIDSLMAAPLFRDDVIVGFIGVDDPEKNAGNLTLLRSVSEFVQAELERRRLVNELEHMSFTDALTGLRNRNQYTRALKEYERRTPETLGAVIADINGLKGINDAHGQSYGDHVVKRVGQAMAKTLSGTVFRTGGGEFIALFENISREALYQEIAALRSTFEKECDCSVAVGCAWQEHEENLQKLLKQAGELLLADKKSYYHTVLLEGRDMGTANLSTEVVKEIQEGRFEVHYQPQVDIQTKRIIGAEALVRKRGDDGELIPPTKFIPFYEMEGVIGYVDLFVMDTSCATMRQWIDQGYDLHLSVNFSRVTLLEVGIVDEMRRICEKHQVPTSNITIEVTESISKMDHVRLKELLREINQAGFTTSLDDFGSQYSNLAILATMDFDEIKFDRSLIEALEHNHKSRVVLENSVRICRDLEGTNSLAEGIETEGQLGLLKDYRCDYGQGYYFSRPVPQEAFQALLDHERGIEEND